MNYTKAQLLEAADILDAAHDVILQRGWWPGNAHTPRDITDKERRCISAAILEAMGLPLHVNNPQCSILGGSPAPFWLFQITVDYGLRFSWNDERGRTEDDVFERLRTVAKELREEAS